MINALEYSLENWIALFVPEKEQKAFLDDCAEDLGITGEDNITQEDFEAIYKEFQEKKHR